jgi:DNA-binding response OmpR family regulator
MPVPVTATDLAMPVLGGHPVLVVDADEDTAAAQTAVLRLHGFDAQTARTAQEANTAILLFRPRVVVTAFTLPDADGTAVARHARQQPDPPAVVMLSGRTDAASRAAAQKAGVAEFLLKPVKPDVLVDLVRRLAEPVSSRR